MSLSTPALAIVAISFFSISAGAAAESIVISPGSSVTVGDKLVTCTSADSVQYCTINRYNDSTWYVVQVRNGSNYFVSGELPTQQQAIDELKRLRDFKVCPPLK